MLESFKNAHFNGTGKGYENLYCLGKDKASHVEEKYGMNNMIFIEPSGELPRTYTLRKKDAIESVSAVKICIGECEGRSKGNRDCQKSY